MGYRDNKKAIIKAALKSKTNNVNVVNTPTVKLDNTPVKITPTLRLTTDDLPAIKDWKVGSVYKLELTVEQTSLSQGSEYGDMSESDKATRASFKVLDVKVDNDGDEANE